MKYLFLLIVIGILAFAIYKGIKGNEKTTKEELKDKRIEQENTVQKDLSHIRVIIEMYKK